MIHATLFRGILILCMLSSNATVFYVYTNDNCAPCVERYDYVKNLFSDTRFVKYNIAEASNLQRFNDILGIFQDELLSVPIYGVFHDGRLQIIVAGEISSECWGQVLEQYVDGLPVYVGVAEAKAELVTVLSDGKTVTDLEALFLGTGMLDISWDLNSLILPLTLAALMDAVNPCAVSVLLVMLSLVFYSSKQEQMLSTGFAFSTAVFITYLLMGLGIYQAYGSLTVIKYVTVIFSFSLGTLSIIEFFTGEKKHIPDIFSKYISKYVERVSNPRTGFIAGVVTATLLLPCSSAPYFLAVNLLYEKTTMGGGFLLLALYNFIIILPENRRWVNLLIGLGLILLSLYSLL